MKKIVVKNKVPYPIGVKNSIKLNIFPVIAKGLYCIGVPWKQIGRTRLANFSLIAQGAELARTVKSKFNEDPLKIYFLTMLGGQVHNVSIDIVLAWGLKQRGHEVYFIIDDQTLPITEEKKAGQEEVWNEISAKSYSFGLKYIRACGFDVLAISNIIDIHADRDVSEFATIVDASLLKHYKVGVISEKLPMLEEKRRMLNETARLTALIGDFLVSQHPHRVIMSHGIYTTWGPPFEILKNAGVPIVTYSKTKKKGTEKFNWNMTADWWDVSEEWERVKYLALNDEEQIKIDHYLQTRITHSEDVLVYNFGALEEREVTRKRFNLDPNKLTYTLFTNVLWDAASAQREIAFANPVEWVFETIEWFRHHPEKQLIIKIHPAEKVIGTNQPFAALILEQIELPGNVQLIRPEEEVNSWSIYNVTDLGLVHTTTAGMELPLVNVPCVIVSRTHYREKGFTIDVESKHEYFEYLSHFDPSSTEIDRKHNKVLAERYAYLLFERYQLPFDVFDEVAWTDVRSFKFSNIDELLSIEHFNNIINAVIEQKPFLL